MGLLDADGWAWATVKAAIWFVVIILMLGYIPDRALYFTVNRTIDLGLLAWSPVNFCPAENQTLPCPAPPGSVIPWEPSPPELSLPAPRARAALAQLGTRLLLVGGSDGSGATDTTFVADLKGGTFGPWREGPALPEARTGAAIAVIGTSAYLVGGADADGSPTDTIWALPMDTETSELGSWAPVDGLVLPEPREGAAVLAVSDGLVVAGGRGPDGSPAATTWKATLDTKGVLGQFSAQAVLLSPVADATIAQLGDYIWLFGGSDAAGPVGAVQRGTLDIPATAETPAPDAKPVPLQVLRWAVGDAYNLPEARTAAAGFAANGALYVAGGNDGTGVRNELYWAVPSGDGTISAWKHLAETDLPAAGLEGGSPIVSGSNVFVIGGATEDGVLSGSIRANLAPAEPFFQAGLVGVVVPALRIEGEIGQQLSYLSAAGVATVNFIILVLVGWAYGHPDRVRAWIDRRRASRRGRRA
jgi:hypothetical protein